MKIWLSENHAGAAASDHVEVGRYLPPGSSPSEGAVVAIDSEFDGVDTPVAAWIIPAGLSAHMELLRRVLATGRPLMIAVNGTGTKARRAIAAATDGVTVINLFDARDQDAVSYLEQLAWLANQDRAFAVMAGSSEKLVQAAAMGAAHLVVPGADEIDLGALERMAGAGTPDSPRPTSPAEIDHLIGHEASLTVGRAMRAGDMLTADDLNAEITADKGLSPSLAGHIAGRVLRYDIAPGEPLNFGHLKAAEDT